MEILLDKSVHSLKLELTRTTEEEKFTDANSKALYAIFDGVDVQEFKRISKCSVAKEAWDSLETTHEGTDTVKQSKLQMLTTKFETLKMKENETISEFYAKFCDLHFHFWG